jgi:hypothetical protein
VSTFLNYFEDIFEDVQDLWAGTDDLTNFFSRYAMMLNATLASCYVVVGTFRAFLTFVGTSPFLFLSFYLY